MKMAWTRPGPRLSLRPHTTFLSVIWGMWYLGTIAPGKMMENWLFSFFHFYVFRKNVVSTDRNKSSREAGRLLEIGFRLSLHIAVTLDMHVVILGAPSVSFGRPGAFTLAPWGPFWQHDKWRSRVRLFVIWDWFCDPIWIFVGFKGMKFDFSGLVSKLLFAPILNWNPDSWNS